MPLGSPTRPERDIVESDKILFENSDLIKIAKKHQVHPAIICLKWAV